MSDFSELEAELKKLRPRGASPELARGLSKPWPQKCRARTATAGVLPKKPRDFRVNWLGLGLGLAAAAAFLILARVNVDRPGKTAKCGGNDAGAVRSAAAKPATPSCRRR